MRLWRFAHLRDKVASPLGRRRPSQRCRLSILTEPHDGLVPFHSIVGAVRGTTDYGISAGSLRLDTGGLDDLGPFLDFFGNEPAEVGGRARKCRAAEVGSLRLIHPTSYDAPGQARKFQRPCS